MAKDVSSEKTSLAVARTMWRWGGWILGIALSVTARQLLARTGGPEMVAAAIEAVGAFLLTGGIGLFLTWCIYHAWQLFPSQRLRRMEPDLLVASGTFRDPIGNVDDSRFGKNSIPTRAVVRKLDRMGIPRPSMEDGGILWVTYLRRLAGEAQAGAVAEAKTVWGEIQKEQRVQ